MEKAKPIESFKAGGVKASVFENVIEKNGVRMKNHRVVLDRTYKDRNGNWQSTNSFNIATDVPKALLVLSRAYEYMMMQRRESSGESEVVEESL